MSQQLQIRAQQIANQVDAACQQRQVVCHFPVETIVVTKHQQDADVAALYDLGYRHFAENRVEQFLARQAALPHEDIVWHLIGTLQTRKVKQVINHVSVFHALDRLKLAAAIDQHRNQVLDCFVQVNVFEEATKHGITPAEVASFITQLRAFTNIRVVGLMTMAPISATADQLHEGFSHLRKLQEDVMRQRWDHAPCQFLSMGMSQDFEIAIQEGATHIRVGSAFFQNE